MTHNRWRFIDTGSNDAAMNMAIDEAILTLHSQKKVPPTIRFYGWQPAGLSIGYFQKAEQEINLSKVEELGIGFVRRLTGGRAVLHDQELTYSLIVSEDDPLIPSGVTEAYRVISMGLLCGYRELGLAAQFALPHQQQTQQRSSVCFDAPSAYELLVEGKKAAGSAQTRQKGVLLQHGSILLELDTQKLFSLFHFPSDRIRNRLLARFHQKAVAINHLLSSPATLGDLKRAFKGGFSQALGIYLQMEELSEQEKRLANELVKSKYNTLKWNLRR